jgi:hypothetical protein
MVASTVISVATAVVTVGAGVAVIGTPHGNATFGAEFRQVVAAGYLDRAIRTLRRTAGALRFGHPPKAPASRSIKEPSLCQRNAATSDTTDQSRRARPLRPDTHRESDPARR